jgi:hypothetical protein
LAGVFPSEPAYTQQPVDDASLHPRCICGGGDLLGPPLSTALVCASCCRVTLTFERTRIAIVPLVAFSNWTRFRRLQTYGGVS